jgi:PPOX class probable F420-dependent enzyme
MMRRRIGHLATAGASGTPTVVPVCFALCENTLYTAVDEKPKTTRVLRRLRDIHENCRVAFTVDRYEEDWSKLGWVMVRGQADVLHSGAEFELGCERLRLRYAQYAGMILSPLIAVHVVDVRSWGDLDG